MSHEARQKNMSFTTQKPKEKSIKAGFPLVFIDSFHFLNSLLDNSGENDFYDLSPELNAYAFT